MKEGWEYKKLEEVCEKLTDGSHNPPKGISYSEYKMISSQNVYNNLICLEDVRYLSQVDFLKEDKRTKVQSGDVLLTIVGTVGRCAVVTGEEGSITLQRSVAVMTPKSNLSSRFLMYICIGNKTNLNQEAHGIAQKGIYLTQLKNLSIPIPPLSEQQHIVEELDLLSSIIEKKKAQLKELDNLAQSIFYEMFGDPVTNEKGWEVKKLGEMGILARGISKHRPRNAPELLGGTMPLIQTGDIANADMYINSYHNTYSDIGVAQSKVWKAGTLCITIAANIGKCAILGFEACFPDSVVGFTVDSIFSNNEYIYFIFCRLQSLLERNAPSVAQKNINLKILNDLQIPLPSLPLQELFASKIQSIEHQKDLIKQSITEVETLFNSRMDYYFN